MWMLSIAAYDPLGQNFTWNERADNVTAVRVEISDAWESGKSYLKPQI
jgi:hypothetical protein